MAPANTARCRVLAAALEDAAISGQGRRHGRVVDVRARSHVTEEAVALALSHAIEEVVALAPSHVVEEVAAPAPSHVTVEVAARALNLGIVEVVVRDAHIHGQSRVRIANAANDPRATAERRNVKSLPIRKTTHAGRSVGERETLAGFSPTSNLLAMAAKHCKALLTVSLQKPPYELD